MSYIFWQTGNRIPSVSDRLTVRVALYMKRCDIFPAGGAKQPPSLDEFGLQCSEVGGDVRSMYTRQGSSYFIQRSVWIRAQAYWPPLSWMLHGSARSRIPPTDHIISEASSQQRSPPLTRHTPPVPHQVCRSVDVQ